MTVGDLKDFIADADIERSVYIRKGTEYFDVSFFVKERMPDAAEWDMVIEVKDGSLDNPDRQWPSHLSGSYNFHKPRSPSFHILPRVLHGRDV